MGGASFPGYAGFWKRLAAFLIDAMILQVPILLVWSLRSITTGQLAEYREVTAMWLLPSVVFNWVYFACMESSRLQATPGKMILRIKVTGLYGHRIGFVRATGRHFSKVVSGVCLGFGFIAAAFTRRKQAMHDILANCLVVNRRSGLES